MSKVLPIQPREGFVSFRHFLNIFFFTVKVVGTYPEMFTYILTFNLTILINGFHTILHCPQQKCSNLPDNVLTVFEERLSY